MFQSIIKHFANICRISDILYAINRAGGKSENLWRGQSVMQFFMEQVLILIWGMEGQMPTFPPSFAVPPSKTKNSSNTINWL